LTIKTAVIAVIYQTLAKMKKNKETKYLPDYEKWGGS